MKTILNEDFSCVLGVMKKQLGRYPTGNDVSRYAQILKSGGVSTVMINPCGQISYIPSKTIEDYESRYNKTEVDGVPVDFKESGVPSFLHHLYENGENHYAIFFRELGRLGIERGFSIRMNDCHDPRREVAISSLRSDFIHNARKNGMTVASHREIVGYFDDTLDYAFPEVRKRICDYLSEQLPHYECEWIELDFMRDPVCFKPGHEDEGRAHIRSLFREVRKIADRFENTWGHKVRLAIRTYPDPLNDRLSAFDAVGLAREGLVDLVVPTGRFQSNVDNIPLAFWRELLPENCLLAMGPEMCHRVLNYDWSLQPMRTPEHTYAMTHYAVSAGADAIYLFNDSLVVYPLFSEERAEYFRRLRNPESVALLPRRHTLGLSECFPEGGFPYQPLPLKLEEYFFDGNIYPRLVFSTGTPTGDMYILLSVDTSPEDLSLYMNASPVVFLGYTDVEPDFSKSPVLVYRAEKASLKALRQVLEIRAFSLGHTVTFAEMRNTPPAVRENP